MIKNSNAFRYVLFAGFATMFGFMLTSVLFTGHSCEWYLCPYTGIHYGHYKQAVSLYAGEVGTDAYKIDMLHLEHPKLDYDQLDSLLHTPD